MIKEQTEKWNRENLQRNKAVYTAESVACDWAGAVMQKLPENAKKTNALPTDGPTNQPTNRPTDRLSGV